MKKPLLSELTLREKIGQTALAHSDQKGFRDLANYPYGAIWGSGDLQFGINIDEVYPDDNKRNVWLESVKQINKHLRVPVIVAADCASTIGPKEYGYVLDHVSVGATGSDELVYETGVLRGRMLRHYGINWAWSMNVDIPSRFSSGSLGRIYTDDPDKLLSMSIAGMKGFADMGVASTAKHFPGKDDMEYRDSHFSEASMLFTYEEWKKDQGRVFQGMIDAGVDTIMTGHQSFPFYDNTSRNGRYVPSSLSYKVITELLKGEMGFKGVVITDDVWMRSVSTYCDDSLERIYVESLKAGNDVILGVKDCYFDYIEAAVLRGEIPMSRIDDACQRVLDLKEKLGLFRDDYEPAFGDLDEINAAMADFNQRAAKKAISLVCDKNKLFPLDPEKIKKVCIIYSGHDKEGQGKALDNMPTMIKAFEARGAEVFFRRGLLNGYASEKELKQIAEDYDLIVYAGYLMRWVPRGMSSFYGDEVSTFQNALRYGAEKSVGIGLGSPFVYYDFYSAFPAYINIYNYYPELQEAVVAAMYGEIGFEGGEPFKLIPKFVEERLAMLKALEEQNEK